MPSLGSLYYTLGIKDLTDADLQKINGKLKNLGFDIQLTPKILKDLTQSAVPKGIKIELDPTIKNDALARAVEGKVMRIAVTPLLTGFREAIARATRENPPQAEVGVSEARLRTLIQNVLNRQGFILNISTVNDNYSKAIQAKLNGTTYKVKIHADAREITQSVRASLMQVQSRTFGLKVSRDILYRSIDEALGQKRFNINVAVSHDQARRAVQDALLRAQVIGKDQALAYQRLQTGELRAAQAELARLKAAHQGAADAAKAHASASIRLGGAMGSNIKIAGELGSAMASLYSIHAAKEFLSQVIEIGGELEHQKIAMDTIFGDKGKTQELFGQIKGLARQSPFGVMELTASVKKLSAYGVEYNEIYDTAKRLADISAATSVDINRLILAFGKTKSRGFLDGLEAKQFAYANIPIYEMVRKKLEELEGQAVTTADVMARMKKREIGFDIVKDVLWDITDEGGKFYNMQEALAGSVKTSWKLVRDNIELMFGEIAEGAVGSGLKSVAEILQSLTRNWKTMGAMITGGVGAWALYKTAVLSVNAVLGAHVAQTMKGNIAQTKNAAATLKSAMTYRSLTLAELQTIAASTALEKVTSRNILARQRLTTMELKALVAKNLLTKDAAMRLIALGRITPLQARYLVQQNLITAGELRSAGAAGKNRIALRLLGTELLNLGKRAWSAILAFGKIALPMAAISGVVALFQKNSEEMEKAKEIGDNIFTKASEGADNLRQKLEDIKPSEGLNDLEMERGIEDMIQTIRDYSPTPLKDINDALVAQDGHLLTIEERYEALKKKVEALNASYAIAEKANYGNMITNAINDTNEGWLNDDLNKNLKDYSEALKRAEDNIREFSASHARDMRRTVDAALKADAGFREATKGMKTYEEKFRELHMNFQKYGTGYIKSGASLQDLNNFEQINAAYNEAVSDYNKFVNSIMISLRQQGITDISKLTEEMKGALAVSFKSWLDGLDGVSDEVREKFAGYLQKTFGVSIIEDDLTPDWVKAFQRLAKSSTDAATQQAVISLQTKGYNQLSEAEKKVIDDLVKKAGEDIAAQQPDLKNTVQAWFNSNPLMWQVTLQVQEAMQGGIESMTRQLINARGGFSGKKSILAILNRWGKAGTAYGMRNAAQQDLQDAENEFKAAEKLGTSTQAYADAKKKLDETKEALAYAKWEDIQTKDQKSNKHPKGSQKDEFAEAVKERVSLLKKAKSEYESLAKLVGEVTASKELADSPIFAGLKANKFLPEQSIPKTLEDYERALDELQEKLTAKGLKTKKHRELNVEIEQVKFDINKKRTEEALKLALDKVSKEAERQLADWNLFDKIRKATGNQDLAMSIAFGMNADATTDYPALVKKQFAELAKAMGHDLTFDNTTLEQAKALSDDIAKSYQDTASKLEKYAREQKDAIADILNDYQSLQGKLAKIDADRQRKIDTVNRSDMSAPDKAKYIQRINVEADYQKFTQSNEYLQFFAGIYALTQQEATRIGDLIEQNLNRRLQAGTISAEDYYKEIERVRQQLDKLRNVKSDALTFLTGGVKGLTQKRQEENDAKRLETIQKIKDLEEKLAEQKAAVKGIDVTNGNAAVMQTEAQLATAKKELSIQDAIREKLIKNQQQWQKILDIANIAANIAGGLSDAFSSIRDMADAYGADTESNGWLNVGGVLDTLSSVTSGVSKVVQSAMNGDIGGILGGVVSTITSPFTIWSKLHDKKLQKMIDRSKEAAQIMQNQYDILEKRMASFLGNAANMNTGTQGGAYGKQLELMKGQLRELQKQRQAELDKKKTDNSVVEDYNKQIEEMKISIQDFAEEAANSIYGIDLNGWAQQIGDALVDAFAKGEDAAEAFDKTVADIMRSVVKNIIATEVIAPAMEKLRDYLFGENGVFANYKTGGDFKLSAQDSVGLANELNGLKDRIAASQEIWDYINGALGGILDETESSKSGLSAGIQSVTEDTADLLASYFNAFRADMSVATNIHWPKLLEMMPQISALSQSQLDTQRQIAENTLRTAEAAELLVKLNTSMEGSWRRIAMKEWGYY